MGEQKVVVMILKVDLQCSRCYKKVKKILCKFPQIRDQVFNEKLNTVTIRVWCCDPEKIRDKLCCKGGGTIKSIEIKELVERKKPVDNPKPPEPVVIPVPNPDDKHKPSPEDKPEDKQPAKPEEEVVVVVPLPAPDPPEPEPQAPEPKDKPSPKPPEPISKDPEPEVPEKQAPEAVEPPAQDCCVPCNEGRGDGPCYHWPPSLPPPCYDYGRPGCYNGCGGMCPCCCARAHRCEYIVVEESSVCTIM